VVGIFCSEISAGMNGSLSAYQCEALLATHETKGFMEKGKGNPGTAHKCAFRGGCHLCEKVILDCYIKLNVVVDSVQISWNKIEEYIQKWFPAVHGLNLA